MALLAGVLAPYNPIQPVGGLDLGPFSAHHLLGTDDIGRDMLQPCAVRDPRELAVSAGGGVRRRVRSAA